MPALSSELTLSSPTAGSVLRTHPVLPHSRQLVERRRGFSARWGQVGQGLVDRLLCEAHKPLPHPVPAAAGLVVARDRLDDVVHHLCAFMGAGHRSACAWACTWEDPQ